MSAAAEVVDATVRRLADAGARREIRLDSVRSALGRSKLKVAGPVWRLGALCLDANGGVFRTGDVLVIAEPSHPNFRSNLALHRNELLGLALKAGMRFGATVVIDAPPIDLDAPEPPLVAVGDGLGVLWTAGGDPIPLDTYLAERADLLLGL